MPEGIGAMETGIALRCGWTPVEFVPERANSRFAVLPLALHIGDSQHRRSETQRFDSQHIGSDDPFLRAELCDGFGFRFGVRFGIECEGVEEGVVIFAGVAACDDSLRDYGVCVYDNSRGFGIGIATFHAEGAGVRDDSFL